MSQKELLGHEEPYHEAPGPQSSIFFLSFFFVLILVQVEFWNCTVIESTELWGLLHSIRLSTCNLTWSSFLWLCCCGS